MANANAVDFANSAYLTRDANLTGIANSGTFTLVVWFLRHNTGVSDQIMQFQGNDFFVQFGTDNTLRVNAETSGSTDTLDIFSAANSDTVNWQCFMCSVDLSDANKRHMYFGDTDTLTTVSVYDNNDITFTTPTDLGIGANANGTLKLDAALGPFWFNDGQYVDFSVEANRRIFYGPNGKVPAALANSTDGDVGGLGQPIVFLNNPLATYQNNLGTGGGFTENNTLAAVTGPEIESSIAVLLAAMEAGGPA